MYRTHHLSLFHKEHRWCCCSAITELCSCWRAPDADAISVATLTYLVSRSTSTAHSTQLIRNTVDVFSYQFFIAVKNKKKFCQFIVQIKTEIGNRKEAEPGVDGSTRVRFQLLPLPFSPLLPLFPSASLYIISLFWLFEGYRSRGAALWPCRGDVGIIVSAWVLWPVFPLGLKDVFCGKRKLWGK